MNSKFSVDFFSDVKYKKMTAEISYNGQILCQINQDKGPDKMEVEFFHEQRLLTNDTTFKFSIDEFISLFESAVVDLKKHSE